MAEHFRIHRSVGWGHGELEWKRIFSALRMIGYNYVLSLEPKDASAPINEGLKSTITFLSRMLLSEPPVESVVDMMQIESEMWARCAENEESHLINETTLEVRDDDVEKRFSDTGRYRHNRCFVAE